MFEKYDILEMIDKNFIPIFKKTEIVNFSENIYFIFHEECEPIRISKFGKLVIDLIDNKRSIKDIYIILEKKYKKLKIVDLINYFSKLIDSNLLINISPTNPKKKSIWKKIQFIELISFKSDKFYKYIADQINRKFVLIFIVFWLIFIFLSMFHFIFTFNIYPNDFVIYNDLRDSMIWFYPSIIIFSFSRILFHESAHAISCRYFNQKVRRMGFGLYLLHPIFYTNTTNIWKEKNKYKRIFVSLAGPLADISILTVLYILGLLLIENPSYNMFFQLIIFFGIIKALLNLNPFIKLDGYYILMDFLELYNLRKKSLQLVKDLITRKRTDTALSFRKKIFFLIFGILSTIMTTLFISGLTLYLINIIFGIKIWE